jgi:hypothetical protein
MTQEKKKLSPWAWVAIGCAGLVLVGAILASAGLWYAGKKVKGLVEDFENKPVEMSAKAIALANPELEFVSANEEGRTVVFREKKTGKEMTFNFDDVENGNISFDTGDGEVKISAQGGEGGGLTVTQGDKQSTFGGGGGAESLPDWVPIYPDAAVQVGFTSSGDNGQMGVFQLTSDESPTAVLDYYAEKLKEAGYAVERQAVNVGSDGGLSFVTGKHEADGRSVNISVTVQEGKTQGSVQYSQEK